MKLNGILFGLLLIALGSCSKSNIEKKTLDDELYTISFKASTFEQSHETMSLKTPNITKTASTGASAIGIKQLLFVVCDENHFPLSYSRKDHNTGLVDFKLKNGKYIIKAIATTFDQSESELLNENNNSVALYLPKKTVYDESGKPFLTSYNSGEVFIGYRNIEVNKDSTYSDLKLDRFSSRIDLNIKDLSPSDLSYIEIKTKIGHVLVGGIGSSPFEGTRYAGSTISPDNNVEYRVIVDAKTKANQSNSIFRFDLITKGQTFLNLSEKNAYVTITAYNTKNEVISTKGVENVKLKPNTITNLTGNLFDEFNRNKNAGIQVTYNTDFSNSEFDFNF